MASKKPTIIAGTLQTDPRSGGLKRNSDVNPKPIIAETWAEIRDNNNTEVDWLIAGYEEGSKKDITVVKKGKGGPNACAAELPDSEPVFGGCRMSTGRFMAFYYAPDGASVMKKGRASMHKNGVLNILEGCDGELKMNPDYKE